MYMKKMLVLALLAFAACKKDNTNVQQRDYKGKWNILQSTIKEYTLNSGDTVFSKNETTNYTVGLAYMNFQLDNKGGGNVVMYMNGALDSMNYEALTPSYFNLDSTLCEITSLSDSSFRFNTLNYDGSGEDGMVQVKQDFFVLSK
jgi:hypothetical protein